ncbi:MAG: hypothetical protein AAF304_04085 [Pseudomonadota bacterium]
MSSTIIILIDMILLRKGPEDFPASHSLMIILIMINLIVSIALASKIHSQTIAVSLSVLGLIITYIFIKILLVNKAERFTQTFSSMVGVSILIDLISVPVIFPLLNEDLSQNIILLFWLLASALYIWLVVTYGFIISRALSITLGYGVSIAAAYVLVSYMIFELIIAGRVAS